MREEEGEHRGAGGKDTRGAGTTQELRSIAAPPLTLIPESGTSLIFIVFKGCFNFVLAPLPGSASLKCV